MTLRLVVVVVVVVVVGYIPSQSILPWGKTEESGAARSAVCGQGVGREAWAADESERFYHFDATM